MFLLVLSITFSREDWRNKIYYFFCWIYTVESPLFFKGSFYLLVFGEKNVAMNYLVMKKNFTFITFKNAVTQSRFMVQFDVPILHYLFIYFASNFQSIITDFMDRKEWMRVSVIMSENINIIWVQGIVKKNVCYL